MIRLAPCLKLIAHRREREKKPNPRTSVTLTDYLSHLKLRQAEVWLGPDGKKLLRECGKFDVEVDMVSLTPECFDMDHREGSRVSAVLNDALRDGGMRAQGGGAGGHGDP